jgi:response regulator RpfG family c-di-GMP phosphodiesterase
MGDELINVLYVDDESMNLFVLKHSFRNKFNIITAESGAEGLLKLAEHNNISAVISDMRMPKMNGLEFIRKAHESFPDKSYYILTGFEINEEISEAIKENLIQKHFNKPFNVEEIESSIKGELEG